MKKLDFDEITHAIMQTIARNDELFETMAKCIGLTKRQFDHYIENVEFVKIGRKGQKQ